MIKFQFAKSIHQKIMHALRNLISRQQNIKKKFKLTRPTQQQQQQHYHTELIDTKITNFAENPDEQSAMRVQNILKYKKDSSFNSIQRALDLSRLTLTDSFVLKVIKLHSLDWKPAHIFFKWVLDGGEKLGYFPGSSVFNEILDLLGKMRRFDEVGEVLDEMSARDGVVFDEETYGVLVRRYAGAHRVEDAVGLFHRRREFGIENDLDGFRILLMWLCRCKHVEAAESLFVSRRDEFGRDVKTWNIVLNGWCVLGNVYEAKRFWKDMMSAKCKPDLFSYGTFINALTKKGKLGTALKLFRLMWEKECKPDVVICNCVIDSLCFKKRIPKALEVVQEMQERGVTPNVATYNSLIKHLCKIQRMEKVYEILDGMEGRKSCMPNAVTYCYLLRSLKNPDELPGILERMESNGCEFTSDAYNLILKLYMKWHCREKVKSVWDEMERMRLGPDRRSYTIMIHGLHDRGGIEEALRYFREMISKGMIPEPGTTLLVNDMNRKLKESKGKPMEIGSLGNEKQLVSPK